MAGEVRNGQFRCVGCGLPKSRRCPAGSDTGMDFWRVVEILNKRKWLLMLSVIATVVFTFGGTRLVGSKWQAVVRFVTPPNSALTSPTLTANTPDTTQSDGLAAMQSAKAQAAVFEAIAKSPGVLAPVLQQLHERELPANFLKNVEFEAVGPRLFELRVTDTNARRAEEYANALADKFVDANHDLVTNQAKKVVTFLESQVNQADGKVDETRRRYDAYRAQHEIIGTENHNLEMALTRLRDARQKRDEMQQMLAESMAELKQNQADLSTPEPVVVQEADSSDTAGGAVAQLKSQLADAEQQLTALKSRYFDQHPEVKKAQVARDEIAAKLKQATSQRKTSVASSVDSTAAQRFQTVQQLKHDVAGHRAELAALDVMVRNAESDIQKYKGVDGPLATMVGELTERTEAASALKARLNSARMALDGAERQNPVTIMARVDDLNPVVNLSAGRTPKLILLAALCALIGTSGIIIGLDSIDRRLRNVKEAELVLPSRVVAAIPQPMGTVSYADLARATELHPHSIHSESYRFLGIQLLSAENARVRSIMAVSAKAEQGATTTLTNLGITLAQAGKRVIMVDANVRTAELHTVFGVENDFGFTDLVHGFDEADLTRAIRQTSVQNLSVIASGPTPRNPWELFHDSHLSALSTSLHARADYVLYDTPSAAIFTDALNLAPIVDAAFLCVRALEPLTGAEQRMVEQLQQANVSILGSVLTDVPPSVVEGYRNYQHYYQPAAYVAQEAGNGQQPVIAGGLIELPRAGGGDRGGDTRNG